MKNDKTIFWVIGIAILLLLVLPKLQLSSEPENLSGSIQVHYYDKYMNEIDYQPYLETQEKFNLKDYLSEIFQMFGIVRCQFGVSLTKRHRLLHYDGTIG